MQPEGETIFEAIRIIQNSGGLFIKLNDATFARLKMIVEPHYFVSPAGKSPFFPLTWAFDCKDELTTSTANLTGSKLKFSPSGRVFIEYSLYNKDLKIRASNWLIRNN